MRADANIKRAVEDAMRCDPHSNATDIGVSVHEEVVTLGGFGRSDPHKSISERDAKRVQLSALKVIAADRRLRLEGVVALNYIRERSQSALKRIRGVKGIRNLIDVGRRAYYMRFAADREGIALRCRVGCRSTW